MPAAKAHVLATLRQKIATFERGALEVPHSPAKGLFAVPAGHLHEVFAPGPADAAAALGFALGRARDFITPARPGLLILQLRAELQEGGVPYAPGLDGMGFDPAIVTFIQANSVIELLWALEEALACRAVGAVVADLAGPHREMDFTVSRRLALRAASAGVSVFLVCVSKGREASAARYRWRVAPAFSGAVPFDARAPGPPRWRVVLEKGQLGERRPTGLEGETQIVDWTKNGLVLADITKDRRRAAPGPALPRPVPALLGDRLSQAG